MNAEIHLNEPFGYEIFQTVIRYELLNNLEIGSWDGEGSTSCFVSAMEHLSGSKSLQCIEIIEEKYQVLIDRYKDKDFVKCFLGSSISSSSLIDNDFDAIWNSPFNRIPQNLYPKELVKSWFDRDVTTISQSLAFIESNSDKVYDSVLIDGGEFTGYSEFILLKDRTRVFFLDDVHHAFKCNQVYHTLSNDPKWSLICDRPDVRNGFAIFIK
jgi:hypothetical protein